MRYPAFAEIKLDGEFNFIHYHEEEKKPIWTINKYGTTRQHFHDLKKMMYVLNGNKITSAVMLCELYWGQGKAGALYELLSHKKDDNVHIHVFDVLMVNDNVVDKLPLVERKEILWDMIGPWQILDKVCTDKNEAKTVFANAVSQDYEGIVVKSLDSPLVLGPCSWVKMKNKDQNELTVSSITPDKERIEVIHTTKTSGVIVGVKAPNRYKKHIKVGDIVTIEHQGVLPSGSLRHPVLIAKKEWK